MEANLRSGRGVTILEVLVAIGLLGMMTVGVFTAFSVGLRAVSLASGMETAVSLAEEGLTALGSPPCGSAFQGPVGVLSELPTSARYQRELEAARVGEGLWELIGRVSWTQERRKRTITLATLRYVSKACEIVAP